MDLRYFRNRREYCQKEKEHEGIFELQLIAVKQVAYLKTAHPSRQKIPVFG
jgi:hypothetical protein